MDTNVLYSALRSRRGASHALFRALQAGRRKAAVSNHLVHEYEEILKADAAILRLSLSDIDQLLSAVCARSEEWPLSLGWIPVLPDPDDDPLIQLAVESSAGMVVSYNLRDLLPGRRVGVAVLPPVEFLTMLDAS